VLVIGLCIGFAIGCPVDDDPNDNNGITIPTDPADTTDPVDSAFWFGEIYVKLIERIGEVSSEGYADITDSSGVDVAQIVNTQYICSAINAKWGTSFTPVSGTASQAANCEYLLKMIDKANGNSTTYGTSSYATKQVVDTVAVNDAVNRLIVPGDKFVALATSSDKAAYSTNGINWAAVTLPSNTDWQKITYGNDKFVATGSTDKAAYSTNGITWTAATMPSSANWSNVIYANDKFVTVAYNSDKAVYSTDGITWTAATMPSNVNWYSVIYGNGKFITVAANSDKAAYSTNGITWTAATMPSSAYWYSVTYEGD
jgi:hypothetical protein